MDDSNLFLCEPAQEEVHSVPKRIKPIYLEVWLSCNHQAICICNTWNLIGLTVYCPICKYKSSISGTTRQINTSIPIVIIPVRCPDCDITLLEHVKPYLKCSRCGVEYDSY